MKDGWRAPVAPIIRQVKSQTRRGPGDGAAGWIGADVRPYTQRGRRHGGTGARGMIMSRTRAAAYTVTVVGGILVLVALILGFSDVTIAWTGEASLSCGNIFGSQTKLDRSLDRQVWPVDEFQQQCTEGRSQRRSGVW